MSAAISAAPTKKLTSSAPHAGVRRSAPRGTSGWSARRRCSAKATAASDRAEEVPPAPGRRRPRPWGRRWRRRGSRRRGRAASSSAPTRSASTSTRGPSRAGRAAGAARTSTRRAAGPAPPIVIAPIGVSQRPSPANGMKSWPQVRSRIRPEGRRKTTSPPAKVASRSTRPTTSGRRRRAGRGARRGRQRADRRGEDQPDGEVDREDRAPVRHGEHRGAEQRPEHRADLLDRRDDAEGDPAPLDRVEVGDQGERGRHQPAAADALEEPAGDHARHVVGQRRDQRAEGEEHQRHHEDRHPAAQVGDPADQREHRDVAEQEAARRSALRAAAGRSGPRRRSSCRAAPARRRRCRRPRTRRRPQPSPGGVARCARPRRCRSRPAHGAVISFSVP